MNKVRATIAAGFSALCLGVVSAPATAAPVADVQPLCSNAVDVGHTIRDGSYVKSSVSWTKCTSDINRVQIVLYRNVLVGDASQNQLNLNPVDFGSHARTVGSNCSGSGTRTWYAHVEAWNAAGDRVTNKYSDRLTTTC